MEGSMETKILPPCGKRLYSRSQFAIVEPINNSVRDQICQRENRMTKMKTLFTGLMAGALMITIGCDKDNTLDGLSPTPVATPTPAPVVKPAVRQPRGKQPDKAEGNAIVYTTNVQGDPYKPGGTFSVDVAVACEDVTVPIIAYGFRLTFDTNRCKLESVTDVELGGMGPAIGALETEGDKSIIDFGTLGNFQNSKMEALTLCRLTFSVVDTQDTTPYSVIVSEDPDNVALPNRKFEGVPHEFSNDATDPLAAAEPAKTEGVE